MTTTDPTTTDGSGPARWQAALVRLWSLLTLPPSFLHEATHALVALPWAERVGIILGDGQARARVAWADDPPRWAVLLAAHGPAIAGTLVGVVAVGHAATGGVPESLRDWLVAGMLAVWWVVFTAPSAVDLAGGRTTDGD